MPNSVYECGNEKCAYAIDTTTLNSVQLEALRRWQKTCPRCNQTTKWQEKLPLLNTKTTDNFGGLQNANNSKTDLKTASQKRRSDGHFGH